MVAPEVELIIFTYTKPRPGADLARRQRGVGGTQGGL